MTSRDFGYEFVRNEFLLVLIGITIAVILNLFHDYRSQREYLIHNMRVTEERLRAILLELASYLASEEMQRNVWDDIKSLEADLQGYIGDAYEYQDNTFQSHPGYYIDYFEMRMKQLSTLHNLHYEAKRIRMIPAQAQIIADYIRYFSDYVVEHHSPEEQIGKLEQIFIDMKDEPLPESREEFENRAVLYHILMDLEETLASSVDYVVLDSDRTYNITELKMQVANALDYAGIPEERLLIAAAAGSPFMDADGTEYAAVAGMTEQVAALGPLAGLAVYNVGADYYGLDRNYSALRRSIQVLNPSI